MIRMGVLVDGEWVPVDGVRSVELHQEEPGPVPVVTWQTALRTATTQSGKVRRRGRPAWQSPYGPPPRRR
ncbi:hypothetical protein [Streptomyces sp. SID8016]|uniref:hypothetical protein n=1 Tax=Streptomyces sp. SID8016 TaxID=2706098 RepID=UPI0013DBF021|nr:hypothetical protein [Streptomyces sp. SID8016]